MYGRPQSLSCSVFLISLVFLCALFGLLALWTDSNLEWVISYFREVPVEEVQVPYLVSLMVTIGTGGTCTVFNIACEIWKAFG